MSALRFFCFYGVIQRFGAINIAGNESDTDDDTTTTTATTSGAANTTATSTTTATTKRPTAAGLACFLSCLRMLCYHLGNLQQGRIPPKHIAKTNDGVAEHTKVQDSETPEWLLRELLRLLNPTFPPAALALHELAAVRDVTDADCACLAQCLWGLAREIVPRASVPDREVLERSRPFLTWLLTRSTTAREDARHEVSVVLQKAKGDEGKEGRNDCSFIDHNGGRTYECALIAR